MHKDVHAGSHLGRSTKRSTDCKCPTLGWGRSIGRSTVSLGTVDRAVDRPERNCSLDLHGRPGGRPEGSTVIFLTVGRSTGRSFLTLSAVKGQNSYGGYKYPIWSWFSLSFQERKIYILKVFYYKFQKSFRALKIWSLFCFKRGWKIQGKFKEKKSLWELVWSSFLILSRVFP